MPIDAPDIGRGRIPPSGRRSDQAISRHCRTPHQHFAGRGVLARTQGLGQEARAIDQCARRRDRRQSRARESVVGDPRLRVRKRRINRGRRLSGRTAATRSAAAARRGGWGSGGEALVDDGAGLFGDGAGDGRRFGRRGLAPFLIGLQCFGFDAPSILFRLEPRLVGRISLQLQFAPPHELAGFQPPIEEGALAYVGFQGRDSVGLPRNRFSGKAGDKEPGINFASRRVDRPFQDDVDRRRRFRSSILESAIQ